jgi:hypothetical protein
MGFNPGSFHERNPRLTQSWKIASDFLSPDESGQVVHLVFSSVIFVASANFKAFFNFIVEL